MVVGGVNTQQSLFDTEAIFSFRALYINCTSSLEITALSLQNTTLMTAFRLAKSVPAPSQLF